jgi:hypothetical protein
LGLCNAGASQWDEKYEKDPGWTRRSGDCPPARTAHRAIGIRAWSWLHDDDPGHPAADALARAAADLADALEPWCDKYPGVPIRSEFVRGHPAWVLASYSARAQLVVLGWSAGLNGRDLTSIQLTTIGHARGPIAIVPSG